MADARDVESGRPLAPRRRRHPLLRGRARQPARERGLEARDGVGERHGTMDMNEQEPCGAGYAADVIARTTWDAMNA